MMKLSTKGRYGTRLMLDLALHYGEGLVFLKDIAKREEISVGYLEHLIPPLKSAGLIKSSRGAHGGYSLAKEPSEINLREIVQVLEGSLSPVDCIDSIEVCQRSRQCVTRDIWVELGEKILETLENVTLNDLVEKKRNKLQDSSLYYI